MYLNFYRLNDVPFDVTPDLNYFYANLVHREALASIKEQRIDLPLIFEKLNNICPDHAPGSSPIPVFSKTPKINPRYLKRLQQLN